MLRMIALTGVVAAGALIGQLLSMQLQARYRQLTNLRDGLRAMVTEIDYARRPLPEAWESLSETFDGVTARLFSRAARNFGSEDAVTAGKAWVTALQEISSNLELTSDDQQILQGLGSVLGISHREDQMGHIQMVDQRLARQVEEARRDSKRRGKLYRALGLLGGILTAIVLF